MMKKLQKLGGALMLPVASLPICGILMGLGYALAPAAMGAEGATSGFAYVLGLFLVKAGSALMDNIPLLFAVGVAVGLAGDNGDTAALAGLVSWLMITTLLNPETVKALAPPLCQENSTGYLAFCQIKNPFIGILSGIIGAGCCNKFKDTRLPDVLAFFSGKRSVAIVTALASIAAAAVLLFVWPAVFGVLVTLGKSISKMGAVGAGIYAFLNRLLIPTGLHHALNNVFWFDTIGLGDLSAYWSARTCTETGWSVGMYMAGFFPCMMFGIPGAAVAMIRCASPGRRKATAGIVGSAALCAFICGITEPFEFAFMFLAFPLYVVYAALYGVFTAVSVALGFRAGFCFSAGLTDLVFSASLPAASRTWLILPLGIAAFAVFYLVFRFAIVKWNLKTPGREEEAESTPAPDHDRYAVMADAILEGVGGRENVLSATHCITRLRLEVKDRQLVDDRKLKAAGAAAVIHAGKSCVQIVLGTKAQFVSEAFKQRLRK